MITAALAALLAIGDRVGTATISAWRLVVDPGPARPEDAIGALAGSAALLVLAWLAVAVLASIAAAVLSHSVPIAGLLAARVAPALIRHGVAAIVGAMVVGGAGSAAAAADPGIPARAAAVAVLGAAPVAGRPPPASTAGGTVRISAAWLPTGIAVDPGWTPTRPRGPVTRQAAGGPAALAPNLRPVATLDDEVVVRRGDSLWAIAARHLGPGATDAEIAVEWPRWFTANQDRLGRDPDRLTPGERLRPPPVAASSAPAGTSGGTGGGSR